MQYSCEQNAVSTHRHCQVINHGEYLYVIRNICNRENYYRRMQAEELKWDKDGLSFADPILGPAVSRERMGEEGNQ